MSGYKTTSPSKKLRSLRRLLTFLQSKKSSYEAKIIPKITITTLPSLSYLPPAPNLSITKNPAISIPAKRIYHPAIINACQALLRKHPSQLTQEEVAKFNEYKNYKLQQGDPLEDSIVYLPSGGLRTCVQCAQLTWTRTNSEQSTTGLSTIHLPTSAGFPSFTFKGFPPA